MTFAYYSYLLIVLCCELRIENTYVLYEDKICKKWMAKRANIVTRQNGSNFTL
jgi:hypothetical protein